MVETTMVTAEAYVAGFSVITNIEGVHVLKLGTIGEFLYNGNNLNRFMYDAQIYL